MATHLGDLREVVDKPELTFDIDGRHYSVPPVDSKTWLRLQAIQAAVEGGAPAGESISRVELGRISLGAVFDQLTADGVSGAEMQHIMRAAYYWQLGEQEVARVLWADGGKAEAPTGAAESTSTTPTGSTSSASENVTRPPASTTRTTSRRKSATPSPRTKDVQRV